MEGITGSPKMAMTSEQKDQLVDNLLNLYENSKNDFRRVTNLYEDMVGDDALENFPSDKTQRKRWIRNFLETISWRLPTQKEFYPFPLPTADVWSSVVVPDGHTGCPITEMGLVDDYSMFTSGNFNRTISLRKLQKYYDSKEYSVYHKWYTFFKELGLRDWEQKLWKDQKLALWKIFKTVNRNNPQLMPAFLTHMKEPKSSPLWKDLVNI